MFYDTQPLILSGRAEPVCAHWGKGGRYKIKLTNGAILTIHCRPQLYTNLLHYLQVKLKIEKRIYQLRCTIEGNEAYILSDVFKHNRYVALRTPFFMSRKKSIKKAVSVYLDLVYDEIITGHRTQY